MESKELKPCHPQLGNPANATRVVAGEQLLEALAIFQQLNQNGQQEILQGFLSSLAHSKILITTPGNKGSNKLGSFKSGETKA